MLFQNELHSDADAPLPMGKLCISPPRPPGTMNSRECGPATDAPCRIGGPARQPYLWAARAELTPVQADCTANTLATESGHDVAGRCGCTFSVSWPRSQPLSGPEAAGGRHLATTSRRLTLRAVRRRLPVRLPCANRLSVRPRPPDRTDGRRNSRDRRSCPWLQRLPE